MLAPESNLEKVSHMLMPPSQERASSNAFYDMFFFFFIFIYNVLCNIPFYNVMPLYMIVYDIMVSLYIYILCVHKYIYFRIFGLEYVHVHV